MRHVNPVICLLLFLLLAACGGRTVYTHPERSEQERQRDYQQCLFEAQKATGNLPDEGDREDRIEEILESCMLSKGYSSE